MTVTTDTIAAISTAPGEGAVAIIRVSGPEAISVADRIFKCAAPRPAQRKTPALVYGHVVSKGTILDEALLLIMRAPHSYTREDVVEFQCHGGTISAKRVLRAILIEGVRQADPGEFTRRAFINGRLDLLQAEAVLDLIRAQTDRWAALAVEQMDGNLSNSFRNTYDILLAAAADLEATLDFNEGDLPGSFMAGMIQRLNDTTRQMDALLATWDEGHIIREGALVVISGKPNAGKSTLLNALLGKDRVIVSPVPGTTRDVIEEQIIIDGIPVRLVDTAGLRASECSLEQEGVRRARIQIEKADINIHVIDASKKLAEDDCRNIALMDPTKALLVLNKTDLGCVGSDTLPAFFSCRASALSAIATLATADCQRPSAPEKDGAPTSGGPTTLNFLNVEAVKAQLINNKGVTEIKALISRKLGIPKFNLHRFTISERHRTILIDARDNILEAIGMLTDEASIVLAAAKVKAALDGIGQAIGKTYNQELLDSIFARFCVGK